MSTKSILITGAGGGLGLRTAELFAARGWHVFGADLQPPPATGGIRPVELDVTDAASCAAAAEVVRQDTGGLDVVVNFAGVLEIGPLMEVGEAAMRRALDVNVLGTFLVNQAMFPLLRQRSGRIVNISSEAGVAPPGPVSAPYSVSKYAVEAYSDALRRELAVVGIPVVIVEPGSFRTPMSQSISAKFDDAVRPGSPFAPLVRSIGRLATKAETTAKDPTILAEAVWTATTTAKPRTRYLVGSSALQHRVLNALPDRALDAVFRRLLG